MNHALRRIVPPRSAALPGQLFFAFVVLIFLCPLDAIGQVSPHLVARLNESGDRIEVFTGTRKKPIVSQIAKPDFRPFLHPVIAPDGNGELTQFSPGHHKHQTGLYWGFTRVNGRDYFHHPESTHWRRQSVQVVTAEAARPNQSVKWQTVYDMLAEDGSVVLQESQLWSLRFENNEFVMDLEWTGEAKTDVTIGKYDYGGLFLRMPWKKGIRGSAVNGARQKNRRAEGQRSVWLDVGMEIEGREDFGHIAIFDHPQNKGFPQPWRVDGQLGVGPVRARLGDWKIKKGATERILHQLIVYTGELNDVEITNKWSKFSGQGMAWAQWHQAQLEGRAAEFLTPEKAVENMTLQDGFLANVWAAEPTITQPMAFCWDSKGRIWVAENRDYETRKTGFANSGDSRILILEDTDRDGVADRRKVFAEGIPFPSGLAVGMGGVWVGAPPNLLFIPDANGDDKADMDNIEVRLTGWGIRDRHETLNSFHWGPDGWLYGCQGFATPSEVGKPVGKGRLFKHKDGFPEDIQFADEPVKINGGVWRYHPTKEKFEVVAHGFSNPWGIDYDSKGQLFITACVIPHLWHVIPGGIYHRQGGQHYNAHVYDDIKTIATHRHRSAHGGARVYLSDAFPDKYKDRIFMANIHEHALLTDVIKPSGSGYSARHGDDFALANNAQWIGFSVEIGPEGGVYVLDWHDADICGKEVLNKETGRIFRFMPKQSKAKDFEHRYVDLNQLKDVDLVKLQNVESSWHARRARVILQHRATQRKIDQEAMEELHQLFDPSSQPDVRLRALWTGHVTGVLTDSHLQMALNEADPHLRSWAIQFLCENGEPAKELMDTLVRLSKEDASPVVRLYLASAIQRISEANQWEIIESLAQHGEDANDHNLPKMIWFGLEPLVAKSPQRALKLASESQIPSLSRKVARRLADADQLETLIGYVGNATSNVTEMLRGLQESLDGQFDVDAPQNWPATYARLRDQGGESAEIALQLSQQFGDVIAAKAMLMTLQNTDANSSDRITALRGLVGKRRPEIVALLPGLFDDEALRTEAIRAVATYDEPGLSELLIKQYSSYDEADRLEVVHALAARTKSGNLLTDAIRSGLVPRRDVPAYVARLLRRVVGNRFVDVWGAIDELSADKQAQLVKVRSLLTEDAISKSNLVNGRQLFNRTCAQCHKLFGYGGEIGPDITGANRVDREYLLSNILTPSAIIQDAYKMNVILTDDGQIHSGIPFEETKRVLKIRVANRDEPVSIAKSTIESREVADVSMMPDGLLTNLSSQEIIDLIGYLQSMKQVELEPKPQ